jgi:TetR/AcrR family fatty acid metabolism transcriptional regulator
LPPEERRAQIVDAVLRVVSEHGVPSATVARIAAAAGVSEGTLYVYFESRDDMLRAALEAIFGEISDLIESSAGMSAVERLKVIAQRHAVLMKTEHGGFVTPWIEFIAAGPQVGLRDAIAQTQTRAFEKMLNIVEMGQAEGTIRNDLDARRLTWQWYTIMWAENVSSLMGLSEYIDDGHSGYSLDLLLRDATLGTRGAADEVAKS